MLLHSCNPDSDAEMNISVATLGPVECATRVRVCEDISCTWIIVPPLDPERRKGNREGNAVEHQLQRGCLQNIKAVFVDIPLSGATVQRHGKANGSRYWRLLPSEKTSKSRRGASQISVGVVVGVQITHELDHSRANHQNVEDRMGAPEVEFAWITAFGISGCVERDPGK